MPELDCPPRLGTSVPLPGSAKGAADDGDAASARGDLARITARLARAFCVGATLFAFAVLSSRRGVPDDARPKRRHHWRGSAIARGDEQARRSDRLRIPLLAACGQGEEKSEVCPGRRR